MIDRIFDAICKFINWLLVISLAIMVVLVFGNVFLRYAFNSGITVSEELSRWLFVWLTFLGAVVAVREHGHLGTDFLVGRLGRTGKKFCLGLSYILMLFICWLIFKGSLDQTLINRTSTSAAMEVSLAFFSACGVVFAFLAGLILLYDFYKLITGRVRDDDLVAIKESEDVPHGNASH